MTRLCRLQHRHTAAEIRRVAKDNPYGFRVVVRARGHDIRQGGRVKQGSGGSVSHALHPWGCARWARHEDGPLATASKGWKRVLLGLYKEGFSLAWFPYVDGPTDCEEVAELLSHFQKRGWRVVHVGACA